MIHFHLPLLAQVDLASPAATKASRFLIADPLMIVGLAAMIFAAGIFYVAIIRGPKQQGRSRRIYKSESDSGTSSHSSGSSSSKRRKKKKLRRREHRGRNPTLSQTGGLPPAQNPTKEADFFG